MTGAPPPAGPTTPPPEPPRLEGRRAGMVRRLRALLVVLAALAAIGASAYLWWWRPLVLASMRFAVEHALDAMRPRVAFQELDLSGLSTLVLTGVTVGSLDDPESAVVRELRLQFNLGSLLRRELDLASAVRHVELVAPQFTVTLPRASSPRGTGRGPGVPVQGLGGNASFEVSDGRLLLRTAGKNPRVTVVSDIDADLSPTGPESFRYTVALTAPGSPRRGVRVRGTYSPAHLGVMADLKELELAPVRTWSAKLGWKCPFPRGRVSTSLKAVLTRSPPGEWRLARTDGKIRVSGVSVVTPGLPLLERATGRATVKNGRFEIARLSLGALKRNWTVRGVVAGGRPHDAVYKVRGDEAAGPVVHQDERPRVVPAEQ